MHLKNIIPVANIGLGLGIVMYFVHLMMARDWGSCGVMVFALLTSMATLKPNMPYRMTAILCISAAITWAASLVLHGHRYEGLTPRDPSADATDPSANTTNPSADATNSSANATDPSGNKLAEIKQRIASAEASGTAAPSSSTATPSSSTATTSSTATPSSASAAPLRKDGFTKKDGFTGKKKNNNSRIDFAATTNNAYKQYEHAIGPEGLSKLSKETQSLITQQKALFETLQSMAPAVKGMQQMMGSFGAA